MSNVKIFVEDYTQLPPGWKTKRGETGECPRCKRVGVIESRDGKLNYFHRLGYEVISGEELPGVVDDTCANVIDSDTADHKKPLY